MITVPKPSEMCIGFPSHIATGTPSWLQLKIPIDRETDTCQMSWRILQQLDKHNIWEYPQLERLFWNFQRFFMDSTYQTSLKKIPSERDYVTQIVAKIKAAVQLAYTTRRASATNSPLERTPIEFMRSIFPDNTTVMIENMSRAVGARDVNTILQLGPRCLSLQETVEEGKKSVYIWMQRACVGAALEIQPFDSLFIEAAHYGNQWSKKLKEGVDAYNALLAKFEEQSRTSLWRAMDQFRNLTQEVQLSASPASPNVYQGTLIHNGVPKTVAIKALQHSSGSEFTVSVERLRELLGTWNASHHKSVQHIMGVYYIGPQRLPALVSLWRNRGNVVHYIKSIKNDNDPAKVLQRILDIIGQVLEALEHFHEKNPPVVHGNLKGSNILRNDDGDIKLCDFGLARTARRHGSPVLASRDAVQFMSPERLQRKSGPSAADDMWAVSCILVQLATTLLPYHHHSSRTSDLVDRICERPGGLRPVQPSIIPADVWQLFHMNWDVDPEARLTARQTLARLNAIRGGRSPKSDRR